jgi:outer membrane protein assembly factor BamB
MSGAIAGVSLRTGTDQWSVGVYGEPFVINNGRLFVYNNNSISYKGVESEIKAISLKTSEIQWQKTIRYQRNVEKFPAIKFRFDKGILYVQSHTYDKNTSVMVSVLHALSGTTGKELWHYYQEGWDKNLEFNEERLHLVIGEWLYWKVGRRRLYALHLETGELIWQFERSVEGVKWEAAPLGAILPPAFVGETIVTDLGDTVYAFDAKTGAVRWQFPGHWISQMVANREVVVLQTEDPIRVEDGGRTRSLGPESSMLYTLDSQTGKILWQQPNWSQSLVLRDDTLYLFGSEGVRAISVKTGQEQWKRKYPFDRIRDLSIREQTAFLLAEPSGSEPIPTKMELYAIDLTSGENRWRFDLVGGWWRQSPIVYVDEQTLLLFKAQTVYAIDLAQARQSKLALATQEADANSLESEFPEQNR